MGDRTAKVHVHERTLAVVHADVAVVAFDLAVERDVRGLAQFGHELERHQRKAVDLAGEQGSHARTGLADQAYLDAVEVGQALLEVVGIALEHDRVVLAPAHELERTGTDRVAAVVAAQFLDRGAADDRAGTAGASGQCDGQERIRLAEREPDRELVDDIDRSQVFEVVCVLGLVRRVTHALHAPLHRFRVQWIAIVELDALAQAENVDAVADGIPLLGEIGFEADLLAVPGDLEQAVEDIVDDLDGTQ